MVLSQSRYLSPKRTLIIALFVGIALVPFFSTKVHAIPTDLVNGISPGSDTSNAVDASDAPWHTLLQTQHGSVGSIELGMYFANNNADKTFTVNVAQSFCNMNAPSNGKYDKSNPYLYIEGIKLDGSNAGISGNAACNGLDGRTYTIPKELLKAQYQGTTMYGLKVTIRWVTDSDPGAPTGIRSLLRQEDNGLGSNIRFRINMGSGLVGYVNTNNSSSDPNNSIVHMNNAPKGADDYTNIFYPFGIRCGGDDKPGAPVTLYDADQGLAAQNTPIGFYVATVSASGNVTPLDSSEYVHQNGSIQVDDTGTNPPADIKSPNGYPVFYPGGYNNKGGNTTVYIKNMRKDTHYVLMVRNLGHGQFIYIGLPGDAIFGSPSFDYNLDCAQNVGTLTCSYPSPPGDIAIGQSQTVTVHAHAANWGGSPPNPVKISLFPQGFANRSTLVGPLSAANLNDYEFTWTIGPYNSPGTYNMDANVKDPLSGVEDDCPTKQFTVAANPYVSIYGGDAEAGVSPKYDGAAYGTYTNASEPGGFVGWNDTDGSGSWGSAGAQWAVQALGKIYGFASGRAVGTAKVPQYLSFTNTNNIDLNGSNYGGLYDGMGNVKVDYASDINSAAPADVFTTGNHYIAGGNVGTQTVVVTNHSAYIGGSLTYGSTSWASPSTIPSYKLIVVGGDIYIDMNARQLDGTYVAIPKTTPTGSVGGNIYTCSQTDPLHLVYQNLNSDTDGLYYSHCINQLKIFGSLVAKQVHFDRTAGSYRNPNADNWLVNGAAESIIYGPEMWLSNTSGGSNNYSAVTGLPPIL
jgi:hypothetical protein